MRAAIDLRRAALMLLALAGACYPGWLAVGSFAEPPAAKEKADKKPHGAPDKLTPAVVGSHFCNNAGCHGGSPPTKNWKKEGYELLCRCEEATFWEEHDKHGYAYEVLLGERGQRMAKLLGYDVTKSIKCLSCHAVVIKDEAAKDGSGFRYENEKEGVTCVACHGPVKDWISKHGVLSEIKVWRDPELDRAKKERWFGMTDLWNPAKRTKVCASCHIGHAGDASRPAKVVTHDMYAAGHPPLPGFEAAMFSDEMPQHWQYLGQKSKPIQESLGYDGKTREPTQLLLVGAAVSLGESLRLVISQVKESEKPGRDPELAMFDCYSCHHEIRSPSWRLTRPPLGKVGRVPMRTWPIELVRLAVQHLAKDEAEAKAETAKLEAHMSALQNAFTAKQLGDATKIVNEAERFEKWADRLASKLQDSVVDEAATTKLLRVLPTIFADKTLDFDSARQVAWGYEVLRGDSGMGKAKLSPDHAALEKYLELRFPKGRMKAGKSPIEEDLSKRMRKLYDYEPKQFRELLGKLGGSK